MNNEDTFYTNALREIENNNRDEATWARALAQSNGNKDAAVSAYIRLRVTHQKQGAREKGAADQVAARSHSYSRSAGLLLVGGSAICLAGVFMIWQLFTSESPPELPAIFVTFGIGIWALYSYFRGQAYARGLQKFK